MSFWVCIATFLRICADCADNRDNLVALVVALVGNGLRAVPIGLVKRDDTQVVLYVFDGGYSGSQRRGCKNAKTVPLSLSLNASPGGELPPKGAEEECGRKSGVQASAQTSYQAVRSRRSSSVSPMGLTPSGNYGMIAPGNHGDFGFAARSTTPGEGFRGAVLAYKIRKPGAGDFSQSPVGLSYGVSGWGLCSKTENRPLSYNITYT